MHTQQNVNDREETQARWTLAAFQKRSLPPRALLPLPGSQGRPALQVQKGHRKETCTDDYTNFRLLQEVYALYLFIF